MFPNQLLKARVVAGLAAVALVLAACSMHRSHEASDSQSAVRPHAAASSESTAPPDLTATEAAVAEGGTDASGAMSAAASGSAPVINSSAPKSYTVKRGDTLWASRRCSCAIRGCGPRSGTSIRALKIRI